MQGRFTMLGSGASAGVPVIGCHCEVCTSNNPKNVRTRPSGLIHIDDKILLIDVGPDFREQALREKVDRLDGVLLTHTHFDHIAGIDELRIFFFRQRKPLPCLLSQESYNEIRTRYHYLLTPNLHASNFSAELNFNTLPSDRGKTPFCGLDIAYFSFHQATMKVTGFRFGDFAYVSDIATYPETIFEDLKDVKHLVLSALRFTPSPVHLTLDEAVDFAEKVGAKETFLTHVAHEVGYEKANAYLPPKVRLGYDGLEINFNMHTI